MLVLSRKKEEKILIGDNIVIRICDIKGSTVRIGIEAPEEVAILRGELEQRNRRPQHSQAIPVTGSQNVLVVGEATY